MGLERKVRDGGRSVLMGEGTNDAVYEDIIDARYNNVARDMAERHQQSMVQTYRHESSMIDSGDAPNPNPT